MKHVSWFRLLLRAIGLILIAMSLPTIVSGIAGIVFLQYQKWSADPLDADRHQWASEQLWGYLWSLPTLAQFALGLYLLLDARWLIRVCIQDATVRCPACRYDLTGSAPARCPECGVSLPVETFLPARTLLQSADQAPESRPAAPAAAPSAAARPPADPPQAPDR